MPAAVLPLDPHFPFALPVQQARDALRVSLEVAAEAARDGLLDAREHAACVSALRNDYRTTLRLLGVDADALPCPTRDSGRVRWKRLAWAVSP